MRVLSFIPAFLLAAASFVAAAPSCVPVGGGGDDTALAPVKAIINNSTTYLQPLDAQLSALKGDAITADAVVNIVVDIEAVVKTTVDQLDAVVKVDLSTIDLTNLYIAIYGLVSVVLTILGTLVSLVLALGTGAVGSVQTSISALLVIVLKLTALLNIYVVASVTAQLGPLLVAVNAAVALVKNVVLKLDVFIH